MIGSRSFTNLSYAAAIAKPMVEIYHITEFISGGAQGADHLAEEIARHLGLPITVLKAKWKQYGRAAGMIRNQDIIDGCDMALVLWDGKSPGTRDSINKLAKAKKPFIIVRYDINDWEFYNMGAFI